ncbi:hypothetical protein GCM10025876_00330 [Demequina litorisediminis]|uniref:Uncharacterized protein n=1 Tax=Demequina litorisediminis TaxID=1849022 RepID=A0ABQ6I890_9MICO|nr:hypothetical protein GCM10025876_00330 [Demequina litorisediminis]
MTAATDVVRARLVTTEDGGLEGLVDAHIGVATLLGLGVRAGALLLLRHERTEARLVDGHALLGRHLQREVNGEAEGVVEP